MTEIIVDILSPKNQYGDVNTVEYFLTIGTNRRAKTPDKFSNRGFFDVLSDLPDASTGSLVFWTVPNGDYLNLSPTNLLKPTIKKGSRSPQKQTDKGAEAPNETTDKPEEPNTEPTLPKPQTQAEQRPNNHKTDRETDDQNPQQPDERKQKPPQRRQKNNEQQHPKATAQTAPNETHNNPQKPEQRTQQKNNPRQKHQRNTQSSRFSLLSLFMQGPPVKGGYLLRQQHQLKIA